MKSQAGATRTSETVKARAYVDALNRVGYHRDDAAAAARLLAESGQAILRAELWVKCWDETYSTIMPVLGEKYTCREWVQDELWNPESESWAQFCRRCAEAALPFIGRVYFDEHMTEKYGPETVRVHFEAVDKDTYSSS